MKTNLTLIFILICLALSAQEYKYVPFPDSNAVWSEVYWKPISQPDPRWIYNQFALFNEDTVINGITYHKLFHTNASAKITHDNSVFIGGIREDGNKRVFIKYDDKFKPNEPYYKKEFLLYNFGLSIGDTIWHEKDKIEISPFKFIVVKAIDTIQIYNSKRKIFSFLKPPWVYWIEGIGNVKGLLFTSGDLPTNGMNNDLVCMHQNDSLMYYNKAYDGCVPQFVIDDVVLFPNPDIKIYPNPVTRGTVFFENLEFETLELYDLFGKLIRFENIKGISCYELDVLNLPPGIYYYRLKTKGLVPTKGKLIIQ
jgi:hypothetical protein